MDDKGGYSTYSLLHRPTRVFGNVRSCKVRLLEFYHLFRPLGWDEKEGEGGGPGHGPDLMDLYLEEPRMELPILRTCSRGTLVFSHIGSILTWSRVSTRPNVSRLEDGFLFRLPPPILESFSQGT